MNVVFILTVFFFIDILYDIVLLILLFCWSLYDGCSTLLRKCKMLGFSYFTSSYKSFIFDSLS